MSSYYQPGFSGKHIPYFKYRKAPHPLALRKVVFSLLFFPPHRNRLELDFNSWMSDLKKSVFIFARAAVLFFPASEPLTLPSEAWAKEV